MVDILKNGLVPLLRAGRLALAIFAFVQVPLAQAPGAWAWDPEVRDPIQKGMSYATWWSGEFDEPGADRSLESLAATGSTWIALVITGYQQTHTSTTIDFHSERVPADEELIHVIHRAHELGLKVMLKPHLDLEKEWVEGFWRGDIGTEFSTEAEWSAWFSSYREFITHYATLAQTYGADQFCVGTELRGTTTREADLRQVIADVRDLYHGPIVYAALHSEEAVRIAFWDALDYVGVNAYYPLADDPTHHPTREELEAAWVEPSAIMADLSRAHGKPIIITEIGYRSHHGCSGHPWDSWAVSEVDLEEQAFAYEAAFLQLYNQPWLAGIYWWTWYPDRFRSGPCDDSFSPHLNPAEDVLRFWYGAPPRTDPPEFIANDQNALDIYDDGLSVGWQNWSWLASIDMVVPDQVDWFSEVISVELEPWGGFSLHHEPFDTTAYHWFEFHVRSSRPVEPRLAVVLDTADGTRLTPVPVNDCRHIKGGTIASDTWKRVRIPLADLNVPAVEWARFSILNMSGEDLASFMLDDMRLVPAKAVQGKVYLPLITKR